MGVIALSMAGGVMIAVIVILRALTINHLPKTTFVVLWFLALVRLLMPFSIPSWFSAYSAANRMVPALSERMQTATGIAQLSEVGIPIVTLSEMGGIEVEPIVPQTIPSVTLAPDLPIPLLLPAPTSHAPDIHWLTIVYFIGLIGLAIFFIGVYIRGRKIFSDAVPVKDGYAAKWIADNKIRRKVRLCASSRIFSPITYGFLRPVILLPESLLTTSEKGLEYVLAHEMTHIRRFDPLAKLIFTVALCVHWFNPLVWVMYILYNRDVELSCDEAVIYKLGDSNKKDYAMFLIGMQGGVHRFMPLCNSFNKHGIKERVVAVMKYKQLSALTIALAMIMVVCVAAGFATSAESELKQIGNASLEEAFAALSQEYKDMTLTEFNQKVNELFPVNIGGWHDMEYEGITEPTEEQSAFQTALMHSLEEIYPCVRYADYVNPWDPPGNSRLTISSSSALPFSVLEVTGLVTWTVHDADGITVGAREQLLNAYTDRFFRYVGKLNDEEFTENPGSNILPFLRVGREWLTEEMSTSAITLRIININFIANYRGMRYKGYSNFVDNALFPPEQKASTLMVETTITLPDNMVWYGYNTRAEGGALSSDNGNIWYENGYRDPITGVSHRYDREKELYEISPDNGDTWYIYMGHNEEKRCGVYLNADTETALECDGVAYHWNNDAYANYANLSWGR